MRLPGFAEPIPRYAQATMEDWIAAVKREVLSLRQDHDRVAIVAHSLGAAVAIAYLLEEPDAADCAVLLAPAVEVSNRRSPLLSTRVWHEIGRRLLLFTSITYSPFPNDCHDPRERDYPGRMPFTPLASVDQTFRLIDNNRGRAGEFETPLLMVVTKADCVIDWQAAARFYEQAPATPKARRLLTNTGHAIPVDYDWEIVTREIAEFVRATGSSELEKRSHTSSNE
jgi:alpha-beta hydrolase superfamily lysophospholipase